MDISLIAPAFLLGTVVLLSHVPFGLEVLRRGVIFVDVAIAQTAALGLVAAQIMGWEAFWQLQLCVVGAALAAAALLRWTESRWPVLQEAIIGALFVTTASMALLLLSKDPHGGEHFKELLEGQILWAGYTSLLPAAVVSIGVVGAWNSAGPRRAGLFYFLFALAVTMSVQLIGIYLVLASLIIPALAVQHLREQFQKPTAYGIGLLGYGLGLAASLWADVPAGPAIVCALVASGVLFFLASKVRYSTR